MHLYCLDLRDKNCVEKEDAANYDAHQEQSLQGNGRSLAFGMLLAWPVEVGVAHLLAIEPHLLFVNRFIVEMFIERTPRVRVLWPAPLVRGTVVSVYVCRVRIFE